MAQRPSRFRRAFALVALGSLVLPGIPAAAFDDDPSLLREGGVGASAALASMVYSPLKLFYAIGGMTVAGISYLWTWGDRDTLATVVEMSLGGDYVVTPEHLIGRQDLRFTGSTEG